MPQSVSCIEMYSKILYGVYFVSVSQNALKSDKKKSQICPFGDNLTHSKPKSDIPARR